MVPPIPNYAHGKKRKSFSNHRHHPPISSSVENGDYDYFVDDNTNYDFEEHATGSRWDYCWKLLRLSSSDGRVSLLNPTQFIPKYHGSSMTRTKIIALCASITTVLCIIFAPSSPFSSVILLSRKQHNVGDIMHALGDSLPQLDTEGKYHGRYPNSLLTLFYPLTLYRDVVLDQPIDITDVPFFWHPHVMDELAVKTALKKCYKAEIIELNTLQDIAIAKENNLIMRLVARNRVGEGSVDPVDDGGGNRLYNGQRRQPVVIASPHIRHAAELFTRDYSGRVFAFYRHPYDYDLHPALQAIQEEYDTNDFLTRLLADVPRGPLGFKELGTAKHVVRQATVVGTVDVMSESIVRIGKYFGWVPLRGLGTKEGIDTDEAIARTCIENVVKGVPGEKYVDRTNQTKWEEFYQSNRFDCELYEVARSTWRAQIQTIIPLVLQKVRAGEGDEDVKEEGNGED
jgi:hypothetical protein